MTVGETIKKRRIEIDMTQEKLAELVGYSHKSAINKIEMGKSNVSQEKLILLAKALGVTPSYFFYGSEGKETIIAMDSLNENNQKLLISYYNYLLEQQRKDR